VRAADLLRQTLIFVLGVLLIVYDAVSAPPHDWVVITLGLILIGVVPAEYVVKARNGGSSSGPPVE
jgi:hypothetical protein